MIAYEDLLDRDVAWAFREGSMHFEKESSVHKTLRSFARRLDETGVPYAVAGGMALFFHGYRRFTEDVDIVVTAEGLAEIHRHLAGRGYVPIFSGSRSLRDTATGVRIEFLVSGDFPGDGKPKPVVFPDPAEATIGVEGIRFLDLPKIVELKLASGMTNPARLIDLADVQRVIQELNLPSEFVDRLDPFVRDKFRELWTAVRDNPAEA